VLWGRLGIVALRGQPLGGAERLLRLDGEAIWMHGLSLFEMSDEARSNHPVSAPVRKI
jgi:hypothetical protein